MVYLFIDLQLLTIILYFCLLSIYIFSCTEAAEGVALRPSINTELFLITVTSLPPLSSARGGQALIRLTLLVGTRPIDSIACSCQSTARGAEAEMEE